MPFAFHHEPTAETSVAFSQLWCKFAFILFHPDLLMSMFCLRVYLKQDLGYICLEPLNLLEGY